MLKRAIGILIIIAAVCQFAADAQTRYTWKEATQQSVSTSNSLHQSDGVEIATRNGTIIIKNQERENVTVLTILGQTISQTTLPPGVHELKIGTHGIFIVKVGNHAVRIAL